MNTISYLRSAALMAAAFAMGFPGLEEGVSAPNTENHAIIQTPRYLEAHPALLRPQPTVEVMLERSQRQQASLEKLTRNHALVASPRFMEEHPELQRRPRSAMEDLAHSKAMREQWQRIRKNSAWAASPRIIEQFPALRCNIEKSH